MTEKVLSNKKNGMAMLLLFSLLYLVAIAACVIGGILLDRGFGPWIMILGIVYVAIGWLLLCKSFLCSCKSGCRDKIKPKW